MSLKLNILFLRLARIRPLRARLTIFFLWSGVGAMAGATNLGITLGPLSRISAVVIPGFRPFQDTWTSKAKVFPIIDDGEVES